MKRFYREEQLKCGCDEWRLGATSMNSGMTLRHLRRTAFGAVQVSTLWVSPTDYGFTSNTLPAPRPPTSGK